MEHQFTVIIMDVLATYFGKAAGDIFAASPLLQYFNLKQDQHQEVLRLGEVLLIYMLSLF